MTSAAEIFRRRTLIADLRAAGCRCCPERESAIMQLHHVDPALKRFPLGSSRSFAVARWAFDLEIDKVVALCPTCHSKHHAGLLTIPDDGDEPCIPERIDP